MSSSIKSGVSSAGGWSVALGVLVIIAGLLAAATPIFTFISATYFVAAMILVSGVFAIVNAFQDSGAGRKILDIILGVLSFIVALLMFQNPGFASLSLAIWIAIWLIVRGITELIWAFRTNVGRTLLLLNGAVDLFLGIVLLRMDPANALAALGFYIAISLMFWGVGLIFQGSAMRDISKML